MGLFDNFPYTNFHELNLMWILEALKEIQTTTEQFVAINSLKYADPIQWNIVQQYEKNTIVIDPLTGTAYISVQPVPTGVALTNTDYWTVVFDLGSFVTRAAKNFTDRWESQWTQTATFPSTVGDWLVWNDTLYRVISNIVAGDQYVVDSNIKHFTMEEVIGHIDSLSTTDKTSLVNAINELVTAIENLDTKVGDLSDLTTSDITSIVNAINSVVSALDTEVTNNRPINIKLFGVVGDGVTDDTTAFTTALNSNEYIYIPAGTYNVNNITITNRLINVICSHDAAIINGEITFYNCKGFWSGANFSKPFIIDNSSNFVFEKASVLNVINGPCLFVHDSNNIKILNCSFASTSTATHDVTFENSSNCVIDNCSAMGTPINHNIQLHNCESCRITNCYCANAQCFGISIWKSARCLVCNSITKNTIREGINLENASQNHVSDCIIAWDISGISDDFGLSLSGLNAGEYSNENIISDILIYGSKKSGLALAGNCINNEINQITLILPNSDGGDSTTHNAAVLVYPVGSFTAAYNHFSNVQIDPSTDTQYIFYEDLTCNYNIFSDFVSYYTKLPILLSGTNSEYSNIYNMDPSYLTYNVRLLDTFGNQMSDYTVQHAYYDEEGEYVNADIMFTLTTSPSVLPINITLPTASTQYFGQVTAYNISTGVPVLASTDSVYGIQIRNIDNTALAAGTYKVSVRYQRNRT